MPGISFIKMDWIANIDWANIAAFLLQLIVVIGILWVLVHFLIIRPKKYKYHINLKDYTGGGIITSKCRGGWIIDPKDKTGSFKITNDKNAVLKMPPMNAAQKTVRGGISFDMIRFGQGPHDYAVLNYNNLDEDKLPDIVPLADIDWAKYNVKRAADKKNLGNWWAENKGLIIIITSLVMSMIIMTGVVKMAGEQAQSIIGSSRQFTEDFKSISAQLERTATALGAMTLEVVVDDDAPPPPPPPNS